MNIPIGNLSITSFCESNIEHIKFRKELAKDGFIYDFLSHTVEKDLIEIYDNDEIELGQTYLITEENKIIGYIYIGLINDKKGILELRYAVHPKFRRKGYGKQILEQCRDYLFTFEDVNSVELDIRIDNDRSINCAEKAKYKCISLESDSYYVYRTYKGKC